MTDTIVHGDALPKVVERDHAKARQPIPFDDLDGAEPAFKVWTREEAAVLRAKTASVSPWWVVAAQAVVGLTCCALAAWLLAAPSAMWSALYGAVAVVVPSALLARGMTRRSTSAVGLAVGFLFWEMLKIGAAIAMLVIAAKVVPDLSWPVLLVTMVVCMKVNWFALLWRGR